MARRILNGAKVICGAALWTLLGQAPDGGRVAFRPVSLAEAAARLEPDFRPKLLGENVTVRGVAVAPLLEAPDAGYLGIEEEKRGSGLMLIFSGDNKGIQPRAGVIASGSIIEARGVVSLHAGQAVVKPLELRVVGATAPPQPILLRPAEAAQLRYEGMLASVVGEVGEYREASSGDLLEFIGGGQAIRVFLPLPGGKGDRPLAIYHRGDRIRVRGLVSQFCLSPPYNRYFQLLVAHPTDVELLEPRPTLPPQIVPAAVLLILMGIVAAWYMQQRAAARNRMIERILQTSEELYGANTAREVAEVLRSKLLELIAGNAVSVYHYDAARKLLERLPDTVSSMPHSYNIEEGSTAIERAIALSVRNKTLLQFADTRASDLLNAAGEESRSLLVIPMRNQTEVHGAIAISSGPGKHLLPDALHPAAQHLANDACQHLKELEQVALREQIHRSEKLAVAGQLIHGVISELTVPLESIRILSERLPESDAAAIHAQVQKASEMVRRIISVARAEQIDARPVEMRFLFQRLLEGLEPGDGMSLLETEVNLAPDSLYVLGSQDQLANVFENLLQHARTAAASSMERVLILNVNRIGRSAVIEIEFSGPFGEGLGPDFSGAAFGLAISRGLLQSHGGEIRFTTMRAGRYRYEVELPSLSSSPVEEYGDKMKPTPQRGQVTALLVEPETQAQRRLLAIFGELNHRLIPVSNIEEAADLAEKLRFDVVFSSTRPDGGTWAELFHRVHHRTPHFVLMSESADVQSADILDGTSSSMLRKPVDEGEILGLLERLQQSGDATRSRTGKA